MSLFRSMVGWSSSSAGAPVPAGDAGLSESTGVQTPVASQTPDPILDDETESAPEQYVEELSPSAAAPADREQSPSPAPVPVEPREDLQAGAVTQSAGSPAPSDEPTSLNEDWLPNDPPAPVAAEAPQPDADTPEEPPVDSELPRSTAAASRLASEANFASDAASLADAPAEHTLDSDPLADRPLGQPQPCEHRPYCEESFDCFNCPFEKQFLPDGLLYKSYLAGEKEPRFASQWLYEDGRGLIWESAIGGRLGLYRNGTRGHCRPQGFQVDLEGAVFSRIDPEEQSDLDAADFRFGLLMTRREGPIAWKYGYYHISSHVGDEFLIRNPTFDRVNYVRDAAIAGVIRDMTDEFSIYAEAAYAPSPSGGAEPLEFQFGAQYSSPFPSGKSGDPFAALNIHLREEFDFGGSVNAEAGWQWRSVSDRLLRVGLQHYNGKSMQYSFFNQNESLTGLGVWLDY
jgi:hypothetical protein